MPQSWVSRVHLPTLYFGERPGRSSYLAPLLQLDDVMPLPMSNTHASYCSSKGSDRRLSRLGFLPVADLFSSPTLYFRCSLLPTGVLYDWCSSCFQRECCSLNGRCGLPSVGSIRHTTGPAKCCSALEPTQIMMAVHNGSEPNGSETPTVPYLPPTLEQMAGWAAAGLVKEAHVVVNFPAPATSEQPPQVIQRLDLEA